MKIFDDFKFWDSKIKNNVKIVREKSARVEWSEIREFNLNTFLKKVIVYSKGDGQAKIWWNPAKQFSSHNIKISSIFLRYLIFFILLVFSTIKPYFYIYLVLLLIFYFLYPILKWNYLIKSIKAKLYLPVIQVLTDFTTMYGFIAGTISTRIKK